MDSISWGDVQMLSGFIKRFSNGATPRIKNLILPASAESYGREPVDECGCGAGTLRSLARRRVEATAGFARAKRVSPGGHGRKAVELHPPASLNRF